MLQDIEKWHDMKGFEHWSETGSYKTLPRREDERWLEEKRTELSYFYWLQIKKGFDPRTSTATPKKDNSDLVKTMQKKKRQRNKLRVRNRERWNQSEHSAYSATGKNVKGTNWKV